MKKVLIIPFPNGHGHIRRMSILSNVLVKKFDVSILVYKGKIKQNLDNRINKIFVELKYFNYKNFFNKLIRIKLIKKNINSCDIIISDNIHDFTKLNKKVFIFANFFWQKIFKNKKEIKLKKGDKIFCNYLFKDNHIKKMNHYNIPFFQNAVFKKKVTKKNILISIGTADYRISKNSIKQINEQLRSNIFQKYKFYIDPKIFSFFRGNRNVYLANYSQQMYKTIKFAIIKPGMGTIEECLKHNINIIAFIKKMNLEFLHNSKILESKKLGLSVNTLEDSLNLLRKKIEGKNLKFNVNRLKWGGEKKISNILLKHL